MAVVEPFLAALPDAKRQQGVRIEKAKYENMRSAILDSLHNHGVMTFSELGGLVEELTQDDFDGAAMWYYITVKLDLEKRGEIRRVPGSRPELIEAVN